MHPAGDEILLMCVIVFLEECGREVTRFSSAVNVVSCLSAREAIEKCKDETKRR